MFSKCVVSCPPQGFVFIGSTLRDSLDSQSESGCVASSVGSDVAAATGLGSGCCSGSGAGAGGDAGAGAGDASSLRGLALASVAGTWLGLQSMVVLRERRWRWSLGRSCPRLLPHHLTGEEEDGEAGEVGEEAVGSAGDWGWPTPRSSGGSDRFLKRFGRLNFQSWQILTRFFYTVSRPRSTCS